MKVFNLQCDQGHGFEGWFGSEGDFHDQVERGLLECPLCASKSVSRMPSAPRLNLSQSRPPQAEAEHKPAAAEVMDPVPSLPSPQHQAVQALWLKAVRHVMAHTDDVGGQFAEEARRMHYGEAPQRGIRGQTSPDEVEALHDEGIDVFALPIPEAVKGSLQ